MNTSKSSRYHRAKRRGDAAFVGAAVVILGALVLSPTSLRLRDAVGGSPALYALILFLALGVAQLPFAWYRGFRLERQYELSDVRFGAWLGGCLKSAVLTVSLGALAAQLVYWAMRWPPVWWLVAALGCAALMAALTAAGPVLILPFLQHSRPVESDTLRSRLERLSARAGVPVLGVHELSLGDRARRASAALVGAGSTRRIILSDTLLADFSHDEIEVMMAHEMGHHVHHHMLKTALVEFVLLLAGFRVADLVLRAAWQRLGFSSPFDVAGMPLIVLSAGAVMLIATPLLNAWSRAHERRADRFALEVASEPAAFIGAVRRMAAQNLAEERPSSAAFLLFHTHPTAEERVSAAREVLRRRTTEC